MTNRPSGSPHAVSGEHKLDELIGIAEWSGHTSDGTLSDLPVTPSSEVWDEVSAEPDLCARLKCPEFDRCFLFRARRRAAEAEVAASPRRPSAGLPRWALVAVLLPAVLAIHIAIILVLAFAVWLLPGGGFATIYAVRRWFRNGRHRSPLMVDRLRTRMVRVPLSASAKKQLKRLSRATGKRADELARRWVEQALAREAG